MKIYSQERIGNTETMSHDQEFLSQMKHVKLVLQPNSVSMRTGIHEFKHRGKSLEFAEYREYRPGDDLRDFDWKVYARSDRYYLKQRDSYTPARVTIFLDDSASMKMKSQTARVSKLRASLLLVFGIGFILKRQGDPFGFHTLSMQGPSVETRSSSRAFQNLISRLNWLSKEDMSGTENSSWPQIKNKSVDYVICISDFMLPIKNLQGWLDGFIQIAPTVHCFQILDPLETCIRPHPSHVLDLEMPSRERMISAQEWQKYLKNLQDHQQLLKKNCRVRKIHFRTMQTDSPLY